MDNDEQSEPVQDGSLDATDAEKKQGILEQVAADMRGHPLEDVIEDLNTRFTECGVPVSPDEVRTLARSIVRVD